MSVELRLGKYQDVLRDIECDAFIGDGPFGARTHEGGANEGDDGADRTAIDYDCWTPDDVHELVRFAHPRTRGWIAQLTSHDLIPAWESAFAETGRMFFAPVPCVCTNPQPRNTGDGPTSGTIYLMTARPRRQDFIYVMNGKEFVYDPDTLNPKTGKPRRMTRWGSLPGHYLFTRPPDSGGGGRGKSLLLMEAIVRDYSESGDLVADGTAGWARTLVAARLLGRRAIGAEVVLAAYERGLREIRAARTPDIFAYADTHVRPMAKPIPTQVSLFDGGAR